MNDKEENGDNELRCQYCGTHNDVHIVEDQKGLFSITKYLCLDCYKLSTGKKFVELDDNYNIVFADQS